MQTSVRQCITWLKKFRIDILQQLYYLRKTIHFIFKREISLIGYTKKHPIYTSIFEETPPEGFLFFYFNPRDYAGFLIEYLKKHSALFHLDAANSEFVRRNDKKLVVECEGRPRTSFFNDERIGCVFVESRWSGQEYLEEGRVNLLYPAIRNYYDNQFSKNKSKQGEIILCAVGHGGLVKGFDIVMRLFYELKAQYNLKLILAGTLGHNFEYYPEISRESYENADFPFWTEKLKRDPDVIFQSFSRKELFSNVYPRADIYLHLSRLETFGYSILEAMSFGLPVIASKLHAIPEMVIHDFNGFLVDGFEYDINSQDWYDSMLSQTKEAVSELIDNPELLLKFGNNSKSLIVDKFNIDNKKRILTDCYSKLLQK